MLGKSKACLSSDMSESDKAEILDMPLGLTRQWPVQFSHVHVFLDSHNVQKSVTWIIYLGPLPRAQCRLTGIETWWYWLFHWEKFIFWVLLCQTVQDCYMVTARTTCWPEESLLVWRTSVACCLFMVCQWSKIGLAGIGATCWLSPSARTAVQAIKEAYFLRSVNEKSFWFTCS